MPTTQCLMLNSLLPSQQEKLGTGYREVFSTYFKPYLNKHSLYMYSLV